MENYRFLGTLGEGNFAKVKLATHFLTREKVAVKVIDRSRIRSLEEGIRLNREISIMNKAQHPNIIPLYEVIPSQVIDTPQKIYLVMQFAPFGDLMTHIQSQTRLSEVAACRLFHQLVSGVDYLHGLGVSHRDLKPANILLTRPGELKIADFGLSNTFGTEGLLETRCGSPCFVAPEMIASRIYDGRKVDIWSLGVILYMLLVGRVPFEDDHRPRLFRKICSGRYSMPKYLSRESRDLINHMLTVDPKDRIALDKVCVHPWMTFWKPPTKPEANSDEVNSQALLETQRLVGKDLSDDLKAGVKNSATTTYRLFAQRLERKEATIDLLKTPARNSPTTTLRKFLPERVGKPHVYTNPQEIYRRMAVSFNLSTDEEAFAAIRRQPHNNLFKTRVVQGVSLHHLLYPRIRSPEPRHHFSFQRNSPDLRIEALRLYPQTEKGKHHIRRMRMTPDGAQGRRLKGLIQVEQQPSRPKTKGLVAVQEAKPVIVRRKSVDVKEASKDPEWTSAAKDVLSKEFCRLINLSNGVSIPPPSLSEDCYRYYIGPGNNGALVDRLMRSRKGWVRVKTIEEGDFVWSQKKEPEIMDALPVTQVRSDGSAKVFKMTSFRCPVKFKEPGSGTLRVVDVSAIGYERVVGSPSYRLLDPVVIVQPTSVRTQNKLECNYNLANKKALFLNMKQYYEAKGVDYLAHMPLTFHIVNGEHDPEFLKFQTAFKTGEKLKEKSKKSDDGEPFYNLWIVKPGENSNRGTDITLASMIEHVKTEIRRSVCPNTGKRRTYIVQKYIENPFLYKNRKFDIRCYSLITSINGVIQGYYYPEGYIRTSCREFDLESMWDRFIHLTNDAVQKFADEYGRFEMGNKLSYLDFQRYLELKFPALTQKFLSESLPAVRRLVKDTMEATFLKLDPKRRNPTFEVFGYDFMLDTDLKPWLIEVNTNPCLELSSACLSRVIPSMLEGAFKIVLDSWFPEPAGSSPKKKNEGLYENRWELIFSEEVDGRALREELTAKGTYHLVEREDPALLDLSDEEEMHSDPESEEEAGD